MTRSSDLEERRHAVTEAAWRVLVRDGLPALTVRKVAAEAGLPASSLRYVFPSQSSLREGAAQLVLDRIRPRLRDLASGAGVDDVRDLLLGFLPLDEERRTEMEAYLTLGTAAMTDPALRLAQSETQLLVRGACRQAVVALEALALALTAASAASPALAARSGAAGLARSPGLLGAGGGGVDAWLEAETARLYALLDGLALHLVRQAPQEDTAWAVRVLEIHLRELAAE
jgi:AcrR family transcriptional regulator